MRGIRDIILQSFLNGLPQFLLNWYSFNAKTAQNNNFLPENSETFTYGFGILLISHPF